MGLGMREDGRTEEHRESNHTEYGRDDGDVAAAAVVVGYEGADQGDYMVK